MTNQNSMSQSYAKPAYAWYLVILLTFTYSLAVVDRVSIGLLVEPIQADLALSDTQFGALHGLAFVLFFAVAGFPLGMAVDRWSRKKVLVLGTLVLGLATMGSAFAGTFVLLFIFRVLVGAGDSSISPASSALIADNFPPQKRARAYGVYASGIAIGSGVAFMASAALLSLAEDLQNSSFSFFADMTIWQVCFFLLGIPGILLSILILVSVRDTSIPNRNEGPSAEDKEGHNLKELIAYVKGKKSVYLGLILGVSITYIAGNAFFSWYAAHLIRAFEFSPQDAGGAIGAITVPIGLLSALTSGLVTSYFYRLKRKDAPLLTILIMIVTSVLCLAAAGLVPTASMSLAFFGLSAVTVNWGFPSVLTALNNVTPAQFRGQVTALFTMSLGIISIGIGPILTGALSDTLFAGDLGKSLAMVSIISGIIGFALVQKCRKFYVGHLLEG